jgi:hypothetical protein
MQGDVADLCVCSVGRAREESAQEKGYRDMGDGRCHRWSSPRSRNAVSPANTYHPVRGRLNLEDHHGQLNQSRRANIDRAQLPPRLTCCTATRDGLGDARLAAGARLAVGACASGNSGGVGPASAMRPSVGGDQEPMQTQLPEPEPARPVVTVDQPATAVTGFCRRRLFFGTPAARLLGGPGEDGVGQAAAFPHCCPGPKGTLPQARS